MNGRTRHRESSGSNTARENKMLQGQALEIILDMARSSYSKTFGPSQKEKEAIEEVEQLLSQFEDTGNYTEDDYMED